MKANSECTSCTSSRVLCCRVRRVPNTFEGERREHRVEHCLVGNAFQTPETKGMVNVVNVVNVAATHGRVKDERPERHERVKKCNVHASSL